MADEFEPGDVFAETAGDPGEAADLPATTGRDPAAGVPDTVLDEAEVDGE